jgi:quercetin dioxygenase-like cupin family protein
MTTHTPQPLTTLDLGAMAEALLARVTGKERLTERVASVDGVTVLLLGLEAGATLKEHAANGVLTLQVLRGSVDFVVEGESTALGTGQAVMLPAGVRHAVEAREPSVAVLLISETGHG